MYKLHKKCTPTFVMFVQTFAWTVDIIIIKTQYIIYLYYPHSKNTFS